MSRAPVHGGDVDGGDGGDGGDVADVAGGRVFQGAVVVDDDICLLLQNSRTCNLIEKNV